ncbi:MAG: hypothetical protein QM762_13130 [Chryseolinea sp.]
MFKLKSLLVLIFLAFPGAAFSQLLMISDLQELCDTPSYEDYLVFKKGGWERLNVVCQFPFDTGYKVEYWRNEYLDLSVTTSDGHRSILVSTLSREFYEEIRESLQLYKMKKRLVGYSDGEYRMQIYSVAREYGPGFYYKITMERL